MYEYKIDLKRMASDNPKLTYWILAASQAVNDLMQANKLIDSWVNNLFFPASLVIGFLNEAIELISKGQEIEGVRHIFKGLPDNSIKDLRSIKKNELLRKLLRDYRHRTFHYDLENMEESLKIMGRIIDNSNETNKIDYKFQISPPFDTHFTYADHVQLNYLLEFIKDLYPKENDLLRVFVKELSDVVAKIINILTDIIAREIAPYATKA